MAANLYSTTQVARLIGISVKTLRVWDRVGKYKPQQRVLNGARFYTDEDLEPLKSLSAAVKTRPKNPRSEKLLESRRNSKNKNR